MKTPAAFRFADPVLIADADAIRALGKRVVGDIIEIGRLLTECKRIVGHGNWLPWLEREFGWTERTAENYINIHKASLKFENFSNLNLPISVIYLLAAPSTPQQARDEIVEQAKTGAPVTVVAAKQTISTVKARQQPASKSKVKIEAQQPDHIDFTEPDARQVFEALAALIAAFEKFPDGVDLFDALPIDYKPPFSRDALSHLMKKRLVDLRNHWDCDRRGKRVAEKYFGPNPTTPAVNTKQAA